MPVTIKSAYIKYKDGQGPVTVVFTVADGALKATEQADSMNFVLEIENLEYYS